MTSYCMLEDTCGY